MVPRRRAVLAGASTLFLAGCTSGGNGSDATTTEDADTTETENADTTTATTDTPTDDGSDGETTGGDGGDGLPADLRREDGGLVVDYPAFSDGDVTVERESSVVFDRGERFQVLGIDAGELIDPGAADPLVEVSRSVAPDRAWAFVAPVLREGSGFEFRVYANAAFRELGEMQVLAGVNGLQGSESNVLSRAAAFEELADGVFRDTTSGEEVPGAQPGDQLTVLVSDVSFSQLNQGSAAPTGVLCQAGQRGSSAPNVAWNFNYDPETGSLTIGHEGGDTVEGSNLSVRLGGDPTDTQFEGPVSAGDIITVDASGYDSGTTLRIVWQNPEDDSSAVIGEYVIP
jgi:hypothetical protein